MSKNGMLNLDKAAESLRAAKGEFRAEGLDEMARYVGWLEDGVRMAESRLTVELMPEAEFVARGMAIMGEDQ